MSSDFECIGYMKSTEGENDFSMFINENTYGSTGGFEWRFLDFCPEDILEHKRIFIHLISYDELKRKIINEYEMARASR
jgi:hypothetical protein